MKYKPTLKQPTLFESSHHFIIDSCSVIAQCPNSSFPRTVHSSLWFKIDEMVERQEIVMCSQIRRELERGTGLAAEWVQSSGIYVIEENEEVQRTVSKVVNTWPKLIVFNSSNKDNSSGDAFLIATAIVYGLSIITEEKPTRLNGIPNVAKKFDVKSYNLNQFCELQGWEF